MDGTTNLMINGVLKCQCPCFHSRFAVFPVFTWHTTESFGFISLKWLDVLMFLCWSILELIMSSISKAKKPNSNKKKIKKSHTLVPHLQREFSPGDCVDVFSSVVFRAVTVEGTTEPATFMCSASTGLILSVCSGFWDVLQQMLVGTRSRPVMYPARRLAGWRDPMFPSSSLAWLYDLPFTCKGRNTEIILKVKPRWQCDAQRQVHESDLYKSICLGADRFQLDSQSAGR